MTQMRANQPKTGGCLPSLLYTHLFSCIQDDKACTPDEKALFDAAKEGDVHAVKQLIASHVNVDCTPYGVCVTHNKLKL